MKLSTETPPIREGNIHAAQAEIYADRYDDGSANAGTLAIVEALLSIAVEVRELRRAVINRPPY